MLNSSSNNNDKKNDVENHFSAFIIYFRSMHIGLLKEHSKFHFLKEIILYRSIWEFRDSQKSETMSFEC